MERTKEDARAEDSGAGRGASVEVSEHKAHGGNDAVLAATAMPSLFVPDMAAYVTAGLQLIPLHRWNAVDAKGRARGKSPRDTAWQVREYDSRGVIEEAARTGCNVGVRLSADWLVLDVDPRNFPDKRDSLAELVAALGLDLSSAPHTITGSGGHHYWFRKPHEVEVLDSLDDYRGVEFKSAGRQVVAAGSVHPCGVRYEVDDFAPAVAEAPLAPGRLIEAIRRPARGVAGSGPDAGELTPEKLAETLEQLDPEDFRDHDEWLTLMMACHHATAGEARQEFVDWSTQDPQYADDAWVIGRRWDSLHVNPTAGRRGRPVTIKYLHKVVQGRGGHVARTDPEDDFDPWEPEDSGVGVDDAGLREPPKAEGLDAVVEEMNRRHYVVQDSGFQVISEEPDPIFDGRVRYLRHSKSDFRSVYENQLVEKGGKLVSRAELWLKSPNRRAYKGIIFDPARDHPGWLNTWKGWSVEPRKGDWSLLDSLIREVLTDGDELAYEYVLDWIAFMIQHPESVPEVAIAFRGEKGTGKGTLGRALFKLAGAHGLHISSPGHLVGRFNSHLQNCVCLFADEAFWAGDKAGEAVLKQLVTEPTLTYEGKGRDAVTGRNHVHIIMASNNDWVVPAGMDGERRFAVFNVNDKRRKDRSFFEALNRQLDHGGLAGLLHDMLARDIGDWHPRESVPQTEALAEQIERSQSAEESWWNDVLEAGTLPGLLVDEPWHARAITVELDAVYESYVGHARLIGARTLNKIAFGMKIRKRAGIERVQVVLPNRRKVWRWVLPRLDEARAMWARSIGRR